ncbi:MAG: outer membrane protein assembly factor BamA [Candidatus Eisenbacteria bacterium RBG_19FT_COMBO_70_11]|nr:MAG: outer membrane protein assembly factor BamA [Candidatus Eisenbacteria bacterium RBG_19FT_COMBO_70_11]
MVERVGRVSVVGNVLTDSTRILRTFEVGSGSRYNDDAVRRGIRKLFALGLFSDVWAEKFQRDGTVDLLLHVSERPRITRIEFSGNQKRESSELEKKLQLRVGETYSPTAAQSQVDSLLTYYRDEGFAQASVEAVADTTVGPRQVALRFVIREGERVKITNIRFEGASAFAEGKLRKKLKTRRKGLFGGGEVKLESFKEDAERLESFFRNNGYRDMRVVGHALEPGDQPRHLTYAITIDEGRRYRIGSVSWSGNHIVSDADLTALWQPKPGEVYDQSRIQRTQGLAYADYAEKGYLYLSIEPRETVRDSVVDVAYGVTEGQPSNVRLVEISGNRATREKVIRREIDIHEGDRFKRSALVRTQGDIFRLGIFEDVQVDFSPADSTDVDIQLKVKEKQVGTASAGAGYTSQSGVTGFIELGHNNVLGNAQSLSLHLERGSNLENYFVSFTEPWFRDTPTLLGFSAFNSSRDYDLYRQKRVGGSGRIGRPLPWPDYSRGSMSYQLENVTISGLTSSLTPADSIALIGLTPGKGQLTSSLSFDFLRNSADNPFYPTKGTRLAFNSELAGGPFGGSVSYHKHRIEGRIYLPSVLRGVTTMLRARIGLLGEYGDQNSSIPAYERFRLGGGTTSDPLRGYDDYQIVPEKFIVEVPAAYRTDTTIVGIDTTYARVPTLFQKVRYPGGRFAAAYSVEQQFPIVHPLHGVLFFDAGNTWDLWGELRPLDLKMGAGLGFRMEIPLLGNIGFDYGYGFNRDDGPRAVGHFLLGNVNF